MPLIKLLTNINADQTKCFDLARDIDFHQESLRNSNERAIDGKTSGLIELGEFVTWEATHLGQVQHFSSKITQFHRPHSFVDEMISGPFDLMKHEHFFSHKDGVTKMVDIFYYRSPFGLIGHLADWIFLKKYITNLLKKRNSVLKIKAESN